MGKIFVWVSGTLNPGDLACTAIAEDGTALGGHVSSNELWAKSDMGVTTERKHERYREHYPDGFEVIWVENPNEHSDFARAYMKHKEKYGEDSQAG